MTQPQLYLLSEHNYNAILTAFEWHYNTVKKHFKH